jgi:signal transduction histidine kinase
MRREMVLVVDDDPTARLLCRKLLEGARYEVVAVADGRGAREALTSDPRLRGACDLAVLDYVLPDDNGCHLFHSLRRLRPDLAGLLVTGQASLHLAVEALNFGFSQVLAKPVDAFGLREAAEAALADRRNRLENARLRALTRLYDALGELAAIDDAEQLYTCIVRLARAETNADAASLMLLDEQRAMLRMVAAEGLAADVMRQAQCGLGEPISGWVVRSGVVLELTGAGLVPAAIRPALRRPEVTAALCLPLTYGERPMGVLNISRLHRDQQFRPGDVELATIIATDAALAIGRLKMLAERARGERVATVGRLASTIIHDLRGPVTIIRGAAELLEDEAPEHRRPLRVIARQVSDLEDMCEQLLSFARDASSVVFEEFSLKDLLADVAQDGQQWCRQAGLDWECAVEGDGRVEAARSELTRVLTQLVHAACESAASGSAVHVSGRLASGQVELKLVGCDDAPQRWLTDADAPAAIARGGAELSLALARHIVERHRGAVEVETDSGLYALTLRWPQRPAA